MDHLYLVTYKCPQDHRIEPRYLAPSKLEKTLESPLDCKEIQPVHPKGDQSWVFTGRTDAEASASILWPPPAKSWLIWQDPDAGRDWGQEEKGTTEDKMAGWHHWLNGRESEWTSGVGEAWHAVIHGVSKSQTQLSDWTELKQLNKKLTFIKLSI